MQLNANHAREFLKILGSSDLKFQAIESSGSFKFEHVKKGAELSIDPSLIASLIHMQKGVQKGQTPQEAIDKQIAAIKAELGL